MKQTLLNTISSLAIATFMTACTGQVADSMASVGNSNLTSDPCPAIDKKMMKLDRFTEVVKNTSAFHLEEKASAIATPGITVSNNRKQMLRDADKKYAEYAAERQRYGCETPVTTGIGHTTDKMAIVDQCTAIDNKIIRLDRFTEVVKNTSAFHLEEKATAIATPGITVSNNRKQMLRDADKKYTEYAAERQEYGCETPRSADTVQMAAGSTPTLSSDTRVSADKERIKPDEFTTKVNNTSAIHVEEKAAVLPALDMTVSNNKEQMSRDAKKKDAELSEERQKYVAETPVPAGTTQIADKKAAVSKSASSSDQCEAIDIKLIKLYEFTIMVNNTSAFHLEEKAAAMPVPGITVSNNKKKMLKDAEKKSVELLAEREKYGCESAED